MSAVLTAETFGDKLYDSLPEVYRISDEDVNNALQRFLQCLSDGGYALTIEEINGILKMIDPDKIDLEWLPILFKAYGLEIFNGIPEIFLRKLLPTVSTLYARKGSISSVQYIISIISGVRIKIDTTDIESDWSITVYLEMDYEAQGRTDMPRLDQLGRIIKEFLPFYLDAYFIYKYVFYENANLHVEEEFLDDEIFFSYLDKIRFNMVNSMSLLNRLESEISDNFILTDINPEMSEHAMDAVTDVVSNRRTNSNGEDEALSLNDEVLYDKIYINGKLIEEIEY